METYNLLTNEIDSLPQGKADFLLLESNNATLDAEYIINEKLLSSLSYSSISTPAVITRAIHNLNPFSSIEALSLKFESKNAEDIFAEGMILGRKYDLKGNYLILELGETQTDISNILDLGYTGETNSASNFDKLSKIKNKSLIFCAGFLMEASRRFHIVLSGGTQIFSSLIIADKLREDILMRLKHDNITLTITQWLVEDKKESIMSLISELSYSPHIIYTNFELNNSEISTLQEYDKTLSEYSIDPGASLAYGATNRLSQEAVLNEVEILIYSM